MAFAEPTARKNTLQILDRALNLYKGSFRKIWVMALVLSIVVFTPRIMLLVYGSKLLKFNIFYHQLAEVLLDILSVIFFTAMMWDMRCVMTGQKENVGKDFQKSFNKIPLIIGASIVESIIFLVTTLTFFIIYTISLRLTIVKGMPPTNQLKVFLLSLPMMAQVVVMVSIFILLLFYLPIIVTENKGVFSALIRSAKLVWHNIWRVLKVQLTPWFIYSLWLIFFKNVFGLKIHIYFFPVNNLTWDATIVHILVFAFFVPWYAATLLVQLNDLELRKKLESNENR